MRCKDDIRREMLAWRGGLETGFVSRASKVICDCVAGFKETETGNIMCYMPVENETDISPLFEIFEDRLYFPVCDGERLLAVRRSSRFMRNRFGIPEPVGRFAGDIMDVVITPGVAFNRQGYRIGWGKGYYDRFFDEFPDTFKIGVCYERQRSEDFLPADYDAPVDVVVTETGVYPCAAQ